jgi:hypothetical protein
MRHLTVLKEPNLIQTNYAWFYDLMALGIQFKRELTIFYWGKKHSIEFSVNIPDEMPMVAFWCSEKYDTLVNHLISGGITIELLESSKIETRYTVKSEKAHHSYFLKWCLLK